MFHKFPKITNVGSTDPYQGKYTSTLSDWVATEKIDGCNVSIIIDENRNVTFAGRTQVLSSGYDIYQLRDTTDNYKELTDALVEIANNQKYLSLNVYGEYYGLGIQDRIYYGDNKHIRIYAALVNDTQWLSITEFLNIFGSLDQKWIIPVLGKFNSWDSALQFAEDYGVKNNLVSVLSTNDTGEGIILYPASKPVPEEFIAYKYKTEKFREGKCKSEDYFKNLQGCKNGQIVKIQQAQDILKSYINENRVYSLFSKVGKPAKEEIGNFLAALVQDALEDCLADYPELFNQFSNKDLGKITKLKGYPYQVYTSVK